MKKIVFSTIFTVFLLNNAVSGEITPINENYANKIADAIYIIEGGEKTKYPYGIKSIDTGGNKEKARRICLNTIRNQYIRWQQYGKTNDYLDSLADRYCPPSVDKQGNINWKKNIRAVLNKLNKQ